MNRLSLAFMLSLLASVGWAAEPQTCSDPRFAEVQNATVTIIFEYQKRAEDGAAGHMANGVFVSPTQIATVGHVTADMLELAGSEVILGLGAHADQRLQPEDFVRLPVVSIKDIDTGLSEPLSIIELEAGLLGATQVEIRDRPLEQNEPVFSVFSNRLGLYHAIGWHRIETADAEEKQRDEVEPFLRFLLNAADEASEILIDEGVSGAPIFDCDGRLVSLVSSVLVYQADPFANFKLPAGMDRSELLPPSIARMVEWWQRKPNVTGVPASVFVPE